MDVFLSWSGLRSRFLADALRQWMPRVIQSLRPWMSTEDISAGSRWSPEIAGHLASAKVGIICITPENQSNPWLLFEAGALSKTLDQTYVCPLLFGLSPGQLTGPLAQFQAFEVTADGIAKIVTTLNKALSESRLPDSDLREILEVWWPKLEEALRTMPAAADALPPKRSTEAILEEIVANTREQIRRENVRLQAQQEKDAKFDELFDLMRGSLSGLRASQDKLKLLQAAMTGSAGPAELQEVMRQMPIPDPTQMNRMLQSVQEMKERSREHTETILKTPVDEAGSESKA